MPSSAKWQQLDTGTRCPGGGYHCLVVAMLLPVLVFFVQRHFWSAIQPYAWFLFYPTVFLAVLLGHLWGGIFATLISTVLVWFYFIPPQLDFTIASPAVSISTLVFAASGIAFSFFHEHLYRNHGRNAQQAGETRFRLLFEQAMDGIMITDAGGRFIEVNSRFCTMSGHSREELLGQNFAALLPESDADRIRELISSGPGFPTQPSEWTLLTKDGTRFPVEVTVGQFPDRCWSAIVRDIRERRRAEIQERAAEEKFHAFMDAIPAVAWIKDAAGRHIYLNKAWGKAFGVRREDWIGQPASALMPAAIAARLAEHDAAVIASGKAIDTLEETVDIHGGSRFWNSIKFPIQTTDHPLMVGGVAIDITEQRKAAEDLQSSDELNRAVLDSVRSQVAVLNREGTIIAVNEAWRSFARENSNTPEQEARTGVGTNFLEICQHQGMGTGDNEAPNGKTIHRAVVELLQGKTARFSCDCPCDTSTRQLWFHLNITPLRIPAGGAVVSYFDITEIKRSQEVQRTATIQLKAMAAKHLAIQEEERRLLSMELHDHIGQTLTSLQLYLHALHAELHESDRGRQIVLEGVASVEELVETTRDIARRLRPPALDDLGLASAVRWHVSQIASSTNITINLQQNIFERRLPPALELACFRVLQEAMSNALRHSQAAKLSIALSLEIDGLHLSVKDDGVGFGVDETFKKLHNLASLGLIGMRERVAGLGGRFHINSNPGSGTEIAAYFPLPP
ncbi:MAG TPA: PAS domain S-box protein [Azonexus sp.]|nr:PAS domain S-box protein [Azonexus sp.]